VKYVWRKLTERTLSGLQQFRLVLAGHVMFSVAVFVDRSTGSQHGPPWTSLLRAARLHPSAGQDSNTKPGYVCPAEIRIQK
jgi:hypothetical protein